MTQINAYINFNGNCREAMNFYRDCLGGELCVQTVEDSAIAYGCPSFMQQQVLHASLVKNGLVLMGSDMTGSDGFRPGNTISLSLCCSSTDEITSYFNGLSKGGFISHPLKQAAHGSILGVVTDKFGIRWMLNYDGTQH